MRRTYSPWQKKIYLSLLIFFLGCDGLETGTTGAPIIGGVDTNIEDVPYQVALLNGQKQFCGGAILTPEWVITANHCVIPNWFGRLSVLAGVSRISDQSLGQKIKVAEVYPVPGFTGDTREGKDVALIRLARPLELGTTVAPIAIVDEAAEASGLIAPGVVGKISGWGVTDPEAVAGGTNMLQSVEVPIIDLKDAQKAYRHDLSEDQLAAGVMGFGGKDSCINDSGGPFVVPNENDDGVLLAGVISWGEGCGRAEFPGMYARVSAHEQFLLDTVTLAKRPAPPLLVVNEILADPAHDANGDGIVSSTQDEFIELVNMGVDSVDLSGATLSDGAMVRLKFKSGTELEPGEVLVVFGGGHPRLTGVKTVTALLGLTNKGDSIQVRTATGELLVDVTYGSLANMNKSIVLSTEGDASSKYMLHTLKAKALASPGTTAKGNSFE